MKYLEGSLMRPGDLVRIAGKYRGRVLASMDTGEYLPGEEGWAYLKIGIMVDTDFGGLVHYPDEATSDDFELLERPGS